MYLSINARRTNKKDVLWIENHKLIVATLLQQFVTHTVEKCI